MNLPYPFNKAQDLKPDAQGRVALIDASGKVLAHLPITTAFDLSIGDDGYYGDGFGAGYGFGAGRYGNNDVYGNGEGEGSGFGFSEFGDGFGDDYSFGGDGSGQGKP